MSRIQKTPATTTPLTPAQAERRIMTTVGIVRIAWNATVALAPGTLHRIGGVDFPAVIAGCGREDSGCAAP